MERKRVHVWIEGRVQGVFFRAYMQEAAVREGVAGWVRNLADGRVEAVLEGEAELVDRVLQWCQRGSPMSRVDRVEIDEEPVSGEFLNFNVKPTR